MNTTETNEEWATSPPPSCPTLRLLYSGDAGMGSLPSHALQPGSIAIGREPPEEQGICLPEDRRASRVHATFHFRSSPDELRLTDGGSKNGTFVNGRRVAECKLEDGDLVRVGDSFVLVRYQPARPVDAAIPTLQGSAPAIRALRSRIQLVGASMATVLLLGESGTGKEVAARALHEASGRAGPLVAVNCAAIPEGLAESQLFGHVAGAFSGALKAHAGFFRAAGGGTLFLDEVGELPLTLQPKLLRVLEERAVIPVGATALVPCDVRVVAATHRDLARAVEEGGFRGDLHARLAEIPVRLPALRQRREDILPLLDQALGRSVFRLSPRLVAALLAYPWPYNVRELLKVAAQLKMGAAPGEVLDLDRVADRLVATPAPPASAGTAPPAARAGDATGEEARAPVPTREGLKALLEEHHGNIAHVASAVGRSRRQVDRWLAEHELDAKSYR